MSDKREGGRTFRSRKEKVYGSITRHTCGEDIKILERRIMFSRSGPPQYVLTAASMHAHFLGYLGKGALRPLLRAHV